MGGTTSLVDAAAVYDDFDDQFRGFGNGLVGIFPNRAVLAADLQAMGLNSPEMLDRTVDVTHPAVRERPYTRRRALIVNEVWMRGIVGMGDDSAGLVLRDLADRVERSSFRYVHHWTTGDLLIWDNHRALHKAAPTPAGAWPATAAETFIDGFAASARELTGTGAGAAHTQYQPAGGSRKVVAHGHS